jgi:hypothetical protein
MEATRKLWTVTLVVFIATAMGVVLTFSAQNVSNGDIVPSTSRFATMRYSTQPIKTSATDWRRLYTANPTPSHTVACKKVLINPANSHTVLPGITHEEPLCVQLSIAGGGHYTWSSSSRTPYSALSRKTQQYLPGKGSQCMGLWPGLKLSSSGVLSGTMRFAPVSSYNFTVTATGDHKRIVVDLQVGIGSHPIYPNLGWAGYSVQNGPFNGVSATFNVPRPMSNQPSVCKRGVVGTVNSKCDEAIWAGIGGATSNGHSIIQAGIGEHPITGTREVFLRVWYELFPAPSVYVNLPVHQGNRVSVNIYKTTTPGLWEIRITNDTTGQTFSTLQLYTGSVSSAEWIVEAPGYGTCTLPALTPVTFTHPKYSLAPGGKVSSRTNFWLQQSHVHTSNSLITPRGAFTVTSRLINNK